MSAWWPTVILMLVLTIIATVLAAISIVVAWRSSVHANRSATEARRSADAAEASVAEARRAAAAAESSASAAGISAEADAAADHRARTPQLAVTVDTLAAHDGTSVIYRVRNDGPVDLDSVTVHRPIVGVVEGGIVHPVAPVGDDFADVAEIGPIPITAYERFVLSLGSNETLPDFRVRIVCTAGDESWPGSFALDPPRRSRPVDPEPLGNSTTEPSIVDMEF